MVTAKLLAQLGNQAFMLSAAIAHALRMGTNYAFPRQTIAPRIWRIYFTHLPPLRPGQSTKDYYKEPGPCFVPLPKQNDLTIEGYFQSEKYFAEYKSDIADILQFGGHVADFVAVHIRRGDYLQFPQQFPVLPVDYYFEAISKMKELGFKKFRFFSDDIFWCRKTFADYCLQMGVHADFPHKKDPLTDMKEMYCAEAFIIANSTFSLYPALLRSDSPVVIAPAEWRWFGPAAQNLNSPDRIPERFVKI